jgi:hypothetical protein
MGDGIPQESLKHHAKAFKYHGRIGSKLYKEKGKVDSNIQALKTARDEGRDYHGHPAHDVAEMQEHAKTSAQISTEATSKMNDILRRKLAGHEAHDRLDREYISTSKQAMDDLKTASKII